MEKINIFSDCFHFYGLKGVIYIIRMILPLLQITIVQGFHGSKRIVIIDHVSACIAFISAHGGYVFGPLFSLLFLVLM